MDKLTAKVFRTYNASKTLDELLRKDTDGLKDKSNNEKLDFYNNANREV
jgi:DNA topoisomerase-1